MNKKSAILLFSVLFLLSLGALYVWGTTATDLAGTTLSTAFTPGDGYGVNNWSKSGEQVTLNMTILFPDFNAAEGAINITQIWFEDPYHAVLDDFTNVSNNSGVVYDGSTGKVISTGWDCTPTTPGDSALTYTNWSCTNGTDSELGEGDTFTFMFNYSGNLSDDEAEIVWNVGITATNESVFKTVSTNQDAQNPRLIEVNISDGNTTYANSTWGGEYFLNGPIIIESLIEDAQLGKVAVLGYNCNATNGSFDQDSLNNGGWYAEQAKAITPEPTGGLDQRGSITSSSINCYALYSPDTGVSGDLGIAGGNETFTFAFLVNDTFNHRIMLNGTYGTIDPFNITLDDGEYLPTIERVNVTQTTKGTSDGDVSISKTLDNHDTGGLDGTSDYLAANTVTFDVELKGGDKPEQVYIVWNDTGAGLTTFGPAVIGDSGPVFPYMTNLNMGENSSLTLTNLTYASEFHDISNVSENATTVIYRTTLDLNGNSSHDFVFYVYANNTGNNYTRIAGPYRFIVDGDAPSITMTAPTDRVITPRTLVTYSCKATDSASGANKIMWQLKKPSETVYTEKQGYADVVSGSDSITFTGDDTNLAGEYNVKCLAIDNLGNEDFHISSSSETFSVHYSTTEVGVSEGAAADIDLSTSEEITITEKQGVISTFTLDGTTVHTIKIKTVDELAGTVTIIIESDPIEITLKIGETKEVDIDADGANDISVTLNKITDGAADITTKRLTPLPAKEVPTEEVPPTEKPAEEITPPEAASKTWLWILIIVIIVVIGVGYWFMKRK